MEMCDNFEMGISHHCNILLELRMKGYCEHM